MIIGIYRKKKVHKFDKISVKPAKIGIQVIQQGWLEPTNRHFEAQTIEPSPWIAERISECEATRMG